MTCATCHKPITKNSFFESGNYFCTKECKDEYSSVTMRKWRDDHQAGFDTVFDETEA